MTQGIDMGHSGWGNPDRHVPRSRQAVPAPPAPDVCEMQGPGGWACENKPGHRGEHWADTGARKTYWTTDMIDVSMYPGAEPEFIPGLSHAVDPEREPGRLLPTTARGRALTEVTALAEEAIAHQSPAAWAIALGKIVQVARDA